MEFKEFCKQRDRMCEYIQCIDCKIEKNRKNYTGCNDFCLENPDEAEEVVSKWSEEHPIVTNRDKLIETFDEFKNLKECSSIVTYSCTCMFKEQWLDSEYRPPQN